MVACHPIRVVFRGNCPCVREGPCRTPVAPRRRLTSGGGCAVCPARAFALARSASPPKSAALAPGLFREAGHRRLTQESGGGAAAYGASSRAGWLGGIPPSPPARKSACLRPRHSCLPGTPRVPPPERAPRSRPTVGAPVGRTLAGRTIPADSEDVLASDVPANRATPALCAKPSTRRGTRRQGWTRETCAGASGFACRGRRRYSAKPSCT